MDNQKMILSETDIARAITRMTHQLLEKNSDLDNLVLLGIPSRGVPLAQRIAAEIQKIEGRQVPLGSLDITMYRDDLRDNPTRAAGRIEIPTSIEGKTVVLVDDVLYRGRTIAAALDALKDLGRAEIIRLLILVDRGHRQFPIQADYVGKILPTAKAEKIKVQLQEIDGQDQVILITETPNHA